jgi:hypothetical protein
VGIWPGSHLLWTGSSEDSDCRESPLFPCSLELDAVFPESWPLGPLKATETEK